MYDSSRWRRWHSPNTTTWSRHSRRLEPISPSAHPFCHVCSHARLSDRDVEFQQLSMDPWRSPQGVGDAHLANQSAYFQRNWWPATTRSRLPAPVQTEARTVPFDDGRGPNNCKHIKNAREEAIKTNEHQPVDGTEGSLLSGCSSQNNDLLPH